MTDGFDLDVVIVNYNSGQVLEECLSKIVSESKTAIEINIVDNNSTDDSLIFFDGMNDSVKLLKNHSNQGYSVACNQGAKNGTASQIAFINPDCFINQQQLMQLYNHLEEQDSGALIGCRVVNEDGSLQAASRRRLPTFWRIFHHLSGLSKWPFFKGVNINDSGVFDAIQKVEAVNGACILVKRKVFEELGGFDEAFALHFEDLDLFARLKAKHYTVLYDASVTVSHIKGHATQDSHKIKIWKRQGLLRYLSKHRPQWEYYMAKLLLSLK